MSNSISLKEEPTLASRIINLLKNRMTLLVGIIIFEIIYFSISAPYFATVNNAFNIARQISEIGMISITLTFLLITGHMDLSVGSIVGVCGVTAGTLLRAGQPILLSIIVGVLAGSLVGLINGLIVAKLRIQAVVVTIGTQVMFRGLCYIITSGRAVSGYPQEFSILGNGNFLSIPVSAIVMIVLFVGAYFILEKSYIGRYLFALGNNQNTTNYSGINVVKVKLLLFLASGIVTAIASVFLISRLSSAEATLGSGYELDIITAALIGGIDINGGSGKLQGTFLGILIIGILRNGLNLMGMSVIYQSIILGVLLLVAVARIKLGKKQRGLQLNTH